MRFRLVEDTLNEETFIQLNDIDDLIINLEALDLSPDELNIVYDKSYNTYDGFDAWIWFNQPFLM